MPLLSILQIAYFYSAQSITYHFYSRFHPASLSFSPPHSPPRPPSKSSGSHAALLCSRDSAKGQTVEIAHPSGLFSHPERRGRESPLQWKEQGEWEYAFAFFFFVCPWLASCAPLRRTLPIHGQITPLNELPQQAGDSVVRALEVSHVRIPFQCQGKSISVSCLSLSFSAFVVLLSPSTEF